MEVGKDIVQPFYKRWGSVERSPWLLANIKRNINPFNVAILL
ncbi:hypothetical protein AB395_00002989 [Sinorhizobium fredii CCBAU 45436]|nr:hypothetical protein AB395_00002989 [Sinorhizobium fredii CCBAU 45436]